MMKYEFDRTDIGIIAVTIFLTYLIGWCAGFGFYIPYAKQDLNDISVQAETKRRKSIDNMTGFCESLLEISDRICDDRVSIAFTNGVSTAVNLMVIDEEIKQKQK